MSIEIIKERLLESIKIKSELLNSSEIQNKINKIAEIICDTLKKGGKVIFAGNGGSCSDAFHLAGEFVARFMFDRDPLPAIALGANNSIITAIGNDYAYEQIFSREIAALGNSGDVFLAFSTSGNSPNVLGAVEVAQKKKLQVFGFTGSNGGKLKDMCDCVCVSSNVAARIQEVHILLGHIICEIVESNMFK